MGGSGSKNKISGMYDRAIQELQKHGGDETLGLDNDIPMEHRLFHGGKSPSAESLLQELKTYRLSKSAKAKETVISAVVKTLNELGIEAHGKDIDQVVKIIQDKIPNPRKGDSFTDDAHKQKEVCAKLAKAINSGIRSVYGDRVGDLIDPKGPPEYVCSSVVDFIHSFSSGMQLEYLNVRDSLQKVVTELLAAHEVLQSSVKVFMSKLNENEMDFDTGADKFFEIYKKAEQEIQLKIQILAGLLKLNVMPSLEELELAMKSESEGRDYVNSIIGVGTQDFGDSIAYAINNLGTVVNITNIIDKSLKKINMSMDEYLNIKSLKDLDEILNKKLDEVVKRNNSDREKKDDVTSILIAVDKLKKYFVSKNKLKKMKGGDDENVSGGAISVKYKSPDQIRVQKLDKRLKAMKESQSILYNSFVKELYGAYDELLKVINAFGPKIGREIPIGPHIDDLIQVFQKLSLSKDLRSVHFEVALSGLKNDLRSIDTKDNFVQLLKDIMRHCTEAHKHNGSDYFVALKQAVKNVSDVIERFNKLAKIKFGGEIEEIKSDISAIGGDTSSYLISYDPRYVSKDSIKLDEAVGNMIYYYYIANVKENIKTNINELKAYGNDYEKMLEESIRFKREDLVKKKNSIIAHLDDLENTTGLSATVKTDYIKLLNKKFDSFDNLLRVVEAVDLHLKDNTVSVVDNPEVVTSLKKTLDSSRIIAKWFNEESGTELFKAFLYTTQPDTTVSKYDLSEHPYKAFDRHSASDFGEAIKDFPKTQRDHIESCISNSVDNFQALQNIINIFTIVGGTTKKSLSARQMFKYLVDYIKVSSVNDFIDTNKNIRSNITNVFNSDIYDGSTTNINKLIPRSTTKILAVDAQPVHIQKDMNEYFKYVMKAITGKIYVVLGLYQLLESPTPMKEVSDVRFILGGSEYDKPTIINEAAELYYRVPRLLEYYRDLLKDSYLHTSGSTITTKQKDLQNVNKRVTLLTKQVDTMAQKLENDKKNYEANMNIVSPYKDIYAQTRRDFDSLSKQLTSAQREADELNDDISALVRNDASYITMLIDPEMRFYELFSIVWEQVEYDTIKNGTYSDIECNKLVAAINKVYNEYKDKKDPVKHVIQEIIWEVNRRYGIITKDEITKFGEVKRYRRNNITDFDKSNGVNMIDILPDEEEIELTGVPSDNIIMDVDIMKSNVDPVIRRKYELNLNRYQVLERFRNKVESSFLDLKDDISDYVKNTYKNTLNHINSELKVAKDFSEKSRIVKKLITGSHKLANISQFKFLMFHETVVIGIQTLCFMIQTIEHINAKLTVVPGPSVTGSIDYFQRLVQELFSICGKDQLIQVTFGGNPNNLIQLDFSKFRMEFETILSDVRKYIELFRPYIPEDIITAYERGPEITGTSRKLANAYTFVDLEDKYIEYLKPSQFLDEFSLTEEQTEFAKTTYSKLKDCNRTLERMITRRDSLGQVLAMMVFYSENTGFTSSPAINAATPTHHTKMFGELFSKMVSVSKNIPLDPRPQDSPSISPITGASVGFGVQSELTDFCNFRDGSINYKTTGGPSILTQFNFLVRSMIETFYDKPLKKMYINLLQPFISGKLSSSVNSCIDTEAENIFPDILPPGTATNLADPKSDAILYLSNALVLRNMIYSVNTNNTQIYIAQNISEIPLYLRESYRGNLPYFIKSFNDLIEYCEFINDLVDETKGSVNFTRHAAGTSFVANNFGLAGKNCLEDGSRKAADVFVSDIKSMLSNFVEAITEIKDTCERVYREVADEQLYLQTEPDQYAKFSKKYEKYPIAPISFNLFALSGPNTFARLAPVKDINSKLFRYNYGVRSTLLDTREIDTSVLVFNKQLLAEFNALVTSDDQISLDSYNLFSTKVIQGLRYFTNLSMFKRRFWDSAPALLAGQIRFGAGPSPYGLASPVINTSAQKLIDIMLSNNPASVLDQFLLPITSKVDLSMKFKSDDEKILRIRDKERRYNFVDLNVVPINPNALMRDIPLTNLFNYNFTFEKMLSKFLPRDNAVINVMYKLLIDPYRKTLPTGQSREIWKMFCGVGENIFGRPKFVSDQLFNKVLLSDYLEITQQQKLPKYGDPAAPVTENKFHEIRSFIPQQTTLKADHLVENELGDAHFPPDQVFSNSPELYYTMIDTLNHIKPEKIVLNTNVTAIEKLRRFNTNIVRNMLFITNIFRIIRLKLEQDLVDRKKILLSTHSLVDSASTEFKRDERFSDSDYVNDVAHNKL